MDDLNIQITGSDAESRRVVSTVVANALDEAGFTDVSLINKNGETENRTDEVSILEVVSAARPELFATPVSVYSNCAPQEQQEPEPGEGEAAETEPEADQDVAEVSAF